MAKVKSVNDLLAEQAVRKAAHVILGVLIDQIWNC